VSKEKQEEDYFNASDEEDVIGPKQPSSSPSGSKRKRVVGKEDDSTTTNSVSATQARITSRREKAKAKSGFAVYHDGTRITSQSESPSRKRISPKTSRGQDVQATPRDRNVSGSEKGGLVDYDDGSDSDGSVTSGNGGGHGNRTRSPSPSSTNANNGSGSVSPTGVEPGAAMTSSEELEEDLGDVAMKMRAKRQREEEEEEGFVGLLGKAKSLKRGADVESGAKVVIGLGGGIGSHGQDEKEEEDKKEGVIGEGRKIRLSFGLGKKLVGDDGS
jgi:hypothetical protein